jgi:hypothetical protein
VILKGLFLRQEAGKLILSRALVNPKLPAGTRGEDLMVCAEFAAAGLTRPAAIGLYGFSR